ncbi:MAG: hypothetical protein RIC81_01865 [Microcella pacifica]|jgi:hypothetical protein|uniref:Uncharacterized protein n=1 Tax=Microcella pacifica TaxID=2591847 RepID=A0A9E5JNW3_9MICO|nr:hypothetical protein [Microcella pacifica]MBR22889.1 hypothetical protein [Leifsonia sp.]NHF64163.1 hypothetical protein [Microcella pacifica]
MTTPTPSPRVNLFETRDTGITEIMDGPWKDIRVVDLDGGESFHARSTGEEHALFVMAGAGIATAPETGAFRIEKDSAIALPLDGFVDIVAGDDGMRMLQITMTIG